MSTSISSFTKPISSALISTGNPYAMAAGAAVGLAGLVDKIGQGRTAANKFTQNGGPQDIINKQLAAISSSTASASEKATATEKAWTDFLTAANQFAAANPKQSTVVQQAIYKTPTLTKTVQDLMGKDPLSSSFTQAAAPGIATGAAGKNPGPSVWGTIADVGASLGGAYAGNLMRGKSISSAFGAPDGTGGFDPSSPGTWGWGGDPTSPRMTTGGGGGVGGILGSILGVGGNNGGGGGTGSNSSGSLLQRLMPNLVSSGTSLLGGVIASRAAGKAASVQSDAALEAARLNAQAGKDALDFSRGVMQQQQQNLQPWLDAGTGALRTIGDITSRPGYAWNETFKAPTPEEAMADPMIQFQLDRGRRAVEANLRAHGASMSGGAIKELNAFSQGVAGQGYQRVRENALQDYNTRYNTFANERSAQLNPELALAGLGQTATSQLGNELGASGNEAANIGLTTASRVGDLSTSAAAARASGYGASGNIWGTTLGNIGNNILDQNTLNQLLRRVPINGMS